MVGAKLTSEYHRRFYGRLASHSCLYLSTKTRSAKKRDYFCSLVQWMGKVFFSVVLDVVRYDELLMRLIILIL